jgi:hypothetical protein
LHEVPLPVDALEPAVDAGLIEVIGGEVRFRHPLIRSAVGKILRQLAP